MCQAGLNRTLRFIILVTECTKNVNCRSPLQWHMNAPSQCHYRTPLGTVLYLNVLSERCTIVINWLTPFLSVCTHPLGVTLPRWLMEVIWQITPVTCSAAFMCSAFRGCNPTIRHYAEREPAYIYLSQLLLKTFKGLITYLDDRASRRFARLKEKLVITLKMR